MTNSVDSIMSTFLSILPEIGAAIGGFVDETDGSTTGSEIGSDLENIVTYFVTDSPDTTTTTSLITSALDLISIVVGLFTGSDTTTETTDTTDTSDTTGTDTDSSCSAKPLMLDVSCPSTTATSTTTTTDASSTTTTTDTSSTSTTTTTDSSSSTKSFRATSAIDEEISDLEKEIAIYEKDKLGNADSEDLAAEYKKLIKTAEKIKESALTSEQLETINEDIAKLNNNG